MKRYAIALLFLFATTAVLAQQYCQRPQSPITNYCSNDGDWNDYARCQNDNIEALQNYNREVDEYNECVQQNEEQQQREEQRKEQEQQAHAQHCAAFPDAYDCK